jgi:predicted RNA-binding protein YlqC (UPF0109 family)
VLLELPISKGREPEMSSIDQQFIEYVVKSLVGHPDEVIVERIIDEKGVLLTLTVHPEDLGRVIGRRGSTAQSLRTLLRALGTKNDARYNLKIIDTDKDQDQAFNTSDEPENKPVEEFTSETVENESELTAKTRKELADLDDLDI